MKKLKAFQFCCFLNTNSKVFWKLFRVLKTFRDCFELLKFVSILVDKNVHDHLSHTELRSAKWNWKSISIISATINCSIYLIFFRERLFQSNQNISNVIIIIKKQYHQSSEMENTKEEWVGRFHLLLQQLKHIADDTESKPYCAWKRAKSLSKTQFLLLFHVLIVLCLSHNSTVWLLGETKLSLDSVAVQLRCY